jgi:hypothetical protein
MEPLEWLIGGTIAAYLFGSVSQDIKTVSDSAKSASDAAKSLVQESIIPLIVVGGAAYYFLVLRKKK